MRGWTYYNREIRNWWYTFLALFSIFLSFLAALGAGFAAISEFVLWLKFGEYIKISVVTFMEYNNLEPSFPISNWVGINKIVAFTMDLQLWITFSACSFIFAALAIYTIEHSKYVNRMERIDSVKGLDDYE